MDGQRFDDLTRLIGTGSSRRRVLRLLVGSVVAATGIGRGRASAQDCTNPETCATHEDCCFEFICDGGQCVEETCSTIDCIRLPCCPGSYCVAEGNECASIECRDDGDCPTRSSGCFGGLCVDETYNGPGASCESSGDCDSGLECSNPAPVGVCVEQTTCAFEGDVCVDAADCCGSLTCTGGVCAQPDNGTGEPDDGGDPVGPPDEPSVGNPTLPATGVGRVDPSFEPMAAITLASGAAALLAAKKMREGHEEPTAQ